jgi:hypothetical protein
VRTFDHLRSANIHQIGNWEMSGKGRTAFELLMVRNKRDMTPSEVQNHNPLEIDVGCCVTLENEPELEGIRFIVKKIVVYCTKIGSKKFYYTDYCLKGASINLDKPVYLRLRLIKNDNITIGCSFQLLHLCKESPWNEVFYEYVSANGDCDPHWDTEREFTFKVDRNDEGEMLEEPRRYWRVDGVIGPRVARQAIMTDNGLEHREVSYWDFSRITDSDIQENLWIEMDNNTRCFSLYRGYEILATQIRVF